MKKILDVPETDYDIFAISEFSKRMFRIKIVKLTVYFFLLFASVFVAVWFNSYPVAFIGGVAIGLLFAILLSKQLRGFSFYDYSEISGEIEKFHKDVKVVSTTSVGGVGFGTRRQYDSYKRDEMRLMIKIRDGERKCTYRLKNTSEAHARYYEEKGRAIHIFGTRYPVMPELSGENWLCPICGAFNSIDEKTCDCCGNKILK